MSWTGRRSPQYAIFGGPDGDFGMEPASALRLGLVTVEADLLWCSAGCRGRMDAAWDEAHRSCRVWCCDRSGAGYEALPLRLGSCTACPASIGVRGAAQRLCRHRRHARARFGSTSCTRPGQHRPLAHRGSVLWITAVGVAGVSAGTSPWRQPQGGVRLDFRERVRWGLLRVPTLYVSATISRGRGGAHERGSR